MSVLLGLRDVELAPAGLGGGLGQRPRLLGRKRNGHRQAGLVFGHRRDLEVLRGRSSVGRGPVEPGEYPVREGVRQLPCAVRPEVQVDDRLAVGEVPVDAVDDRRADEFVVLATVVGQCHGGRRGAGVLPHAVDDRVVAGLGSFPAVIAIHREVAPAD